MPFDPRLIAIFCLVFIVLGVFSIINGRKRLLEARAQGQKIVWYRHISILTGIEYILLALTFLTSISINAGWLPKSWSSFLVPFYLIMLLASLALACIVIYQVFRSPRRARPAPQTANASATLRTEKVIDEPEPEMTEEERTIHARKRRERRQKAAEARRRRAGKA
jgi:membrane protein implicated in regulation of membrane protease activity